MTEREYLVALYSFLPFGPARTKLLISYFKSSKNIWKSDSRKLKTIGLGNRVIKEFNQYREKFDFPNYFDRLKKLSINYITYKDDNYPQNLIDLEDAPPVIYVRGKLQPSDVNSIAIVGSRNMTSYGKQVCEMFSKDLSNFGVTIVSGLAFGIDVAAHKACIDAGGRCIAVLASGLDQITPRTNEWLGKKIIKSGGALISEYPLGTIPNKSFFPFRNRIISGLSKAVLIVEGRKVSGTLHTASHAAKQGREVFAIPGQITSPTSVTPHHLIQQGAKLTTSVKEIIDELDMQLKVDTEAIEKIIPTNENETKLLDILATEPLHLDEIARASSLKVSVVSARLTVMELKGLVKNLGGGVYKSV